MVHVDESWCLVQCTQSRDVVYTVKWCAVHSHVMWCTQLHSHVIIQIVYIHVIIQDGCTGPHIIQLKYLTSLAWVSYLLTPPIRPSLPTFSPDSLRYRLLYRLIQKPTSGVGSLLLVSLSFDMHTAQLYYPGIFCLPLSPSLINDPPPAPLL